MATCNKNIVISQLAPSCIVFELLLALAGKDCRSRQQSSLQWTFNAVEGFATLKPQTLLGPKSLVSTSVLQMFVVCTAAVVIHCWGVS